MSDIFIFQGILTVLGCVCWTLGYIVGKNETKGGKNE